MNCYFVLHSQTKECLVDIFFYYFCLKTEKMRKYSMYIDDNAEGSVEDKNIHIGKDKITKWRKMGYAKRFKYKKVCIVKVLSCIKYFAKNIDNETE